jgi:competence protein ComGC
VDLYKIEEKKNPESFNVMKNEQYLTPNQADRANKEFQLNGGIVTKKAK